MTILDEWAWIKEHFPIGTQYSHGPPHGVVWEVVGYDHPAQDSPHTEVRQRTLETGVIDMLSSSHTGYDSLHDPNSVTVFFVPDMIPEWLEEI